MTTPTMTLDALLAEGARFAPPRGQRTQEPRWSLRASADDAPAHLYLYDSIGWPGIEASDVVAQVRALGARPLQVHICSRGGDVFAGLAIYNTLRAHAAPVEMRVEGLAASIASVIAMSGAKLRMARASLFMIHEPHALVIGDAHDMRHMAGLLDKTANVMAEVYTGRGADREQVRAWMHKETWFTSQEALSAQLIDGIDDDPVPDEAMTARASFDLSAFKHPPGAAPVAPSPVHPPRARERARLLARGFELLVGGTPAGQRSEER